MCDTGGVYGGSGRETMTKGRSKRASQWVCLSIGRGTHCSVSHVTSESHLSRSKSAAMSRVAAGSSESTESRVSRAVTVVAGVAGGSESLRVSGWSLL